MDRLVERLQGFVEGVEVADPDLAAEHRSARAASASGDGADAGRARDLADVPEVARCAAPGAAAAEALLVAAARPVLRIGADGRVDLGRLSSGAWRRRLEPALPVLALATTSVGRLDVAHHPRLAWAGTGWLVESGLLVTTRSVAHEFVRRGAGGTTFRVGTSGVEMRPTVSVGPADADAPVDFDVVGILDMGDDDGFDFSFLRVEPRTDAAARARPIPLAGRVPRAGTPIVVVGYAARDGRLLHHALTAALFGHVHDGKALAPGRLTHDGVVLRHDATTLGGGSGSVVLGLGTGEVVGLHVGGRFLEEGFAVPGFVLADRIAALRRKRPAPAVDAIAADVAAFAPATDLRWQNVHENFEQRVRGTLAPKNPNAAPDLDAYRRSADAVEELVRRTLADGDTLRALGHRWSFSRVGAADGFRLDATALGWAFPLEDRMVHAGFRGDRSRLVLAQGGIRVNALNVLLGNRGLSLKTSGASDGQTLAGAVSTGTHGAAVRFGAMPDFVLGLHLATGEGRTIWVDRASSPSASDDLLAAIGARSMRDDEVLRAALVGLGSMGVVLGVLVEVRDAFTLLARREAHSIDPRLRAALSAADPSGLAHPSAGEAAHHFDVVVDPYDASASLVTLMHEVPQAAFGGSGLGARLVESWQDASRVALRVLAESGLPLAEGFLSTDDFLVWLTRNFDALDRGFARALWDRALPRVIREVLASRYPVPHAAQGRHMELFGPTDTQGHIASTAVGLAAADAPRALDLVLRLAREGRPFPCALGMRFLKGMKTSATLGLTRFEKTCVLEVDGIDCRRTTDAYRRLWAALEAEGVEHSVHWGKMYEWTPERTRSRFGDARVDAWLAARRTLLPDTAQRALFSSAFLREAGLA